MTEFELAELLESDDAVTELMELAEEKHPMIDIDEASRMIYVIADWIRSQGTEREEGRS